jgi:hypothetical protein
MFNRLGDLRFQVALRGESYDSIGDDAIFENQDGWNRANFEFAGDLAVIVYIDFADFYFVAEFGGKLFKDRSDRFAWATPWGPEVYDDRDGGTYSGFKVAAVEFCYVF